MKYQMRFLLVVTLIFSFAVYNTIAEENSSDFSIETVEKSEAFNKKYHDEKEKSGKAEVVVTGTRTQKLYKTSPVKTDVISKDKIDAKAANNIFEALSGEIGIIADNQCQNCGLNTVRLNGLEGNYTQILINNVPAISSLASTYIFQQVPVEMIERLEVVKGGGSSLYGSGAIGGVVNIITKKPAANNASLTYKQEFIDGIGNPAYTVSGFASTITDQADMGISVFGSKQERDNYDRNGDNVSDIAELQNTMFGSSFFYSPVKGIDFSGLLFTIKEYRRGGDHLDKPEVQCFVTEQIESDINVGIFKFTHNVSNFLNYELNYNFSYMERDTYYGSRSDLTDNDELRGALDEYGISKNPYHVGSIIFNVIPVKHFTVTAGTEVMVDDLYDGSSLTGESSIDERYYNSGTFLQADYDTKYFNIVGGIRADKHSEMDEFQFSPRLSSIAKFTDMFRLRLSWSTGFKAPQVFDEDFHIEQSTLGGATKNRRIRNSSDLKAEESNSFLYDLSGELSKYKLTLDYSIGGFYTIINDKMEIDYENPSEETPTTKYFDRVNIKGTSKLLGYNFEIGLTWEKYVRLSTGATYVQIAELENGSTMQEVPDVSGYSMLEFYYKGLRLIFSNEIIGKQKMYNDNVGALVDTDRFFVFNAKISYSFNLGGYQYMEIFCGVDNITDAYQKDLDTLDVSGTTVSGERDAGYVYGPGKPRTFFMGAKASL